MPNDTTEKYETEYVLGEDAVYALVNSRSTVQVLPEYKYQFMSRVVQVDPETLTPIGTPTQLGEPTPEPEHLRLRFAVAGGGVYANGPASAYAVNMTSAAGSFAAGGNATHIANGVWAGWDGSGVAAAAAGAEVTIAQSWWAYVSGLESGNAPSPTLLTTAELRASAQRRGIITGLEDTLQMSRLVGLAFQDFALWSVNGSPRPNTLRRTSPARSDVSARRSVIPDFLGTVYFNLRDYAQSWFAEVKAVRGVMTVDYNQFQMLGFVDAATFTLLGQNTYAWPSVSFYTTADTVVGLDVLTTATARRVLLRQRLAWRLAGDYLVMGPEVALNRSQSSTWITGEQALPLHVMPGHVGKLGEHSWAGPYAEDDVDFPDPQP
jgi:hypothetical protein